MLNPTILKTLSIISGILNLPLTCFFLILTMLFDRDKNTALIRLAIFLLSALPLNILTFSVLYLSGNSLLQMISLNWIITPILVIILGAIGELIN